MRLLSMFAGPAGQSGSPLFRYTSRRDRTARIAYCVLFFYALLNGSRWNLLNGFYELSRLLVTKVPENSFWSWIGIAALVATAIGLFAFMERRWKLARTQTDIPLLTLMTISVAVGLGVLVAVIGHVMGWQAWQHYWTAFQWTWQVPAGFFVGKGLNWSVVDRQIAGVQAVDQRDTQDHHPVESTTVVVDHEHQQ